jgi:hypothetical protein
MFSNWLSSSAIIACVSKGAPLEFLEESVSAEQGEAPQRCPEPPRSDGRLVFRDHERRLSITNEPWGVGDMIPGDAVESKNRMPKKNRVQRPKDELKKELREQLQLLRHSCEAFDKGLEAIGKYIALSIRVLIHEHGQSRALLDQVGARPNYFLDSAGPLNPTNMMSELNLVAMLLSTSGARYLPAVAMGAPPLPMRQVRFPDWWNAPVLKDKQGRKLSRRELVRHVTDTDGGAHVDPDLDQAYMDISRNNSLGWTFGNRDVMQALSGRPELAAMRQIAHEVLCTINRFVPEFSWDAVPVIPPQPKAT